MTDIVKVSFELEQDEDGYPPAETEALLAKGLGSDLYRIMSMPVFVLGVSNGDIVRGVTEENKIFGVDLDHEGGHSTLRILVRGPNPNEPNVVSRVKRLKEELVRLQCSWVDSKISGFAALDIPPHASYKEIERFLMNEAHTGWIEVEEAAISSVHREAAGLS